MKRGKLIAFIGPKGVGKSTLTAELCRIQWTQRLSFAFPIRNMLEAIGVSPRYHTDNKNEPIPHIPGNPTARMLMQTLGTEWGRNMVHDDIWVEAAAKMIDECLSDNINVYIDDCRFPNEANVVKRLGGDIVRINPRENSDTNDTHESEQHWKTLPYDYAIDNNGTIKDLHSAFMSLGIHK